MYDDNHSSVTDIVVGTLFFGAINFISYLSGRESAFKEVEDKKQKDDIEELKRKWNAKSF